MKIADLLYFPENCDSEPTKRQLISYSFRKFKVQEMETGAWNVTRPDGKKTWVCSSHEAAKGCIEYWK